MGMIKSDRELAISKKKIQDISDYKSQGVIKGLAAHGLESFHMQIEEEIKEYEDIKKGKIPKYFFDFDNIGLLLIALRIKNGLTQTDLAHLLEVSPSQVSRDENNDYHGVSSLTIKKILKALNENLTVKLN